MRFIRQNWGTIRKVLPVIFLCVIVTLIVDHARTINWHKVGDALLHVPLRQLALAAGIAVIAHLIYSCYDQLGKSYTGHALSRWKVMGVALVSYAFNLNFGSIIGGAAFRYRLYSRFGLRGGIITRVLALSVMTNWLGYFLLAGATFVSGRIKVPEQWPIGEIGFQMLGALLLAIVAAYVGLCAFGRRREVAIRTVIIKLVPVPVCLLQLALSCASWLAIGCVMYTLFPDGVGFPTVFATLLCGAVIGAVTTVPAGLGVLEAVFLAVLGDRLPHDELLAAILAYRATFYLLPLLIAIPLYLALEAIAPRSRPESAGPGAAEGRSAQNNNTAQQMAVSPALRRSA